MATLATGTPAAVFGPWAAGVFAVTLGAALVEGVVRTRRGGYDWKAFAATLGDAVVRRGVDATGVSLVAPLFAFAYRERIATLSLSTAAAIAILFVASEFAYYVYHRIAHRTRWFWASHAVHHTPNELTLAAAMRLGWTGKFTGAALFFAPLVWLGFPPAAVGATLAFNLLYQFWLHAPWMPRLGPLEWVLNTPTHHKVHHAANPEYLDCNYGGVLIVFDRLFGTFVDLRDDVPPRYGLVEPVRTYNPLALGVHGWRTMAREVRTVRGWRRIGAWFAPPGTRAVEPVAYAVRPQS
ncbi:MAG: sterol desaturase family protein [Proteobacteria bacterium]|nr:sterol desaturase family protein [Pseudomonadota bacterium]